MRLTHFSVRNFRSLHALDIDLSNFLCIVGQNNAGKSSALVSLSLFLSGGKIGRSDFYDPGAEVVFRATVDGLTEELIDARLEAGHAQKIKPLVRDDRLTLTRKYAQDGTASIRCLQRVPKAARFRDDAVEALLSGKRGAELKQAVIEAFPELEPKAADARTQADFRRLIGEAAARVPDGDRCDEEVALPTGIDNSIKQILPEPVYIPAVKDLSDDVKAKEAASFGKILRFLFETLGESERVQEVVRSLETLKTLFNVTKSETGEERDERLEQVRDVETTVGRFLREQFPKAKLEMEIQPPELKTIVSNARLFVDDGVRGLVESKGDGLKRAVTFALVRASVELRKARAKAGRDAPSQAADRYLFLFEEPELYLHPQAQRVLFDALSVISHENQVCVSTHSPFFFSPSVAGTFVRMRKGSPARPDHPPAAEALVVNLLDQVTPREAYQIICYESNSAAFFSDRVVLVEGDSDIIYLKHAAKLLNADWCFDARNIPVIRIGGKGNIRKYRTFFEHFGVEVVVIADLDAIVDQFPSLDPCPECVRLHQSLFGRIDGIINRDGSKFQVKAANARDIVGKYTFIQKYDRVKQIATAMRAGIAPSDDEMALLDGLYREESMHLQRQVLESEPEVAPEKSALLERMRSRGVHVWSRGGIEKYYPPGITNDDKPSMALAACGKVTSAEHVRGCCTCPGDDSAAPCEFERVFRAVFA